MIRILWSAGTQKFAIEQAKALSALGHNVDLFFIRKGKNTQAYQDLLRDVNYSVLYESNQSVFVPLYDFITGIFISNRIGDGRVDYNLIRGFPSVVKNRYDLIICQD